MKTIESTHPFQCMHFAFAYMYAHIQAHGYQMHFDVQIASKRHLYSSGEKEDDFHSPLENLLKLGLSCFAIIEKR